MVKNSLLGQRTGGQILIDQLRVHGVDFVFGVPGESFLAALDALRDVPTPRFITCRHEAAAANMAEAIGKLTGRPGVAFVTRGPGACHAAIGLHTAFQDSTPMLLLIGQIARGHREREAFQEIDYRRMFGPLTKWVAEVDQAARLPELVRRAFQTACAGRPGPVALALPEDMLREVAEVADAPIFAVTRPAPSAQEVAHVARALAEAEHPLILVGGGAWDAAARSDLARVAAAWDAPVCATFRAQDRFDNADPRYAGDVGLAVNPALKARIAEADLLLVIGARLGEATTGGFTLIDVPTPRQRMIHVHPGAEELGRIYAAWLEINAAPGPFLAALAAQAPDAPSPVRSDWRAAARTDYERWNTPPDGADGLSLARVIGHLRAVLPEDAILCNGAGNYTVPLHRHYCYRGYPTQLAPTSGAMGYGLPAAIAAKLAYPDRSVIALAGDGCFMMAAQELATAIQHDAAIIVIVVDNGAYGTIQTHQDRHYPGRRFATDLINPDFVALARAHGVFAARVEREAEFPAAFAAARAARRPALILLALSGDTTIHGQARAC